jgi:hypothetical protein
MAPIPRRAFVAECVVWAVAVGLVIAGFRIYEDWWEGIPELFDDPLYGVRDNLWVLGYMAAWIGIPLATVTWLHSRFPASRTVDKAGLSVEAAVAVYATAAVVAALARTALVDCLWQNHCDRERWGEGLIFSQAFLCGPLVITLLRRAICAKVRQTNRAVS